MGHRANLVVVDENDYHLYYCHWCALTIPRDLFWGPEWALGFVAQQESVAPTQWLDNVWAEGGALIDIHAKQLLFWGLSKVGALPRRALYLDIMRHVWQGWTVRWAINEIYDLADYVKLDHTAVTSPVVLDDDEIWVSRLLPLEELDELTMVGTVQWDDAPLQVVPVSGWSRYLYQGDEILTEIRAHPFMPALDLEAAGVNFPHVGFHVEVARRQLTVWSASTINATKISAAWAGWEVRSLGDDYTHHLALADGALTFPIPPLAAMLADIEQELLEPPRNIGLELMNLITGQLEIEGARSDVNPSAMRETLQTTPTETRQAIWEKAVAAWRAQTQG